MFSRANQRNPSTGQAWAAFYIGCFGFGRNQANRNLTWSWVDA